MLISLTAPLNLLLKPTRIRFKIFSLESKDILKGSTMEAVMVEESSTNNPLALVHDQGRLFRMPQAQHGSVQHEIPILNQMSLMNLESDGSGALEADANQASFGAFLDWLLLMPPRSKNN